MPLTRLQTLGICLLLALLCWIPLFYHLDQDAVRLWDESRVAINALEMDQNGGWLVPTFEGKPDHWFTKPPLVVWCVTACMKVFGQNTIALRLPSALAALALAYMLLWFSIRVLSDWRIGFFAALSLLTFRGFVRDHVARTGDVDALLVCWLGLAWLSVFCYLYGPAHLQNRSIWLTALGLCLAFMTKSSAAFLALPGLVAWVAVEKRLLPLLRNWRFYGAFAGAMLLPAIYLYARNNADPGYLAALWENEFLGRLGQTIESNEGPFYYYLELIFKDHLFPYIYFLPLAILLGLSSQDRALRRVVLGCLAIGLPFLLVISLAATKLRWYDAQIYPLAALIFGIGANHAWVLLRRSFATSNQWAAAGVMTAFSLAIFGQNFYYIYRQNTSLDKAAYEPEAYAYAIQDIAKQRPDIPSFNIGAVDYNATALFYAKKWKAERGADLPIYNPIHVPTDTLDTLLVCNPYVTDSLVRIWKLDTLWEAFYGCQLVRLEPLPADSVDKAKLPVLFRRVYGMPTCCAPSFFTTSGSQN